MSVTSSPTQAPGLDLSAINLASSWDRVASEYAGFIAAHAGRYAADALRLANISARDEVLDVATGPGSLALQAARITRVHALDFSAQMLEALRQRADTQQLECGRIRDRLERELGNGPQAVEMPAWLALSTRAS